MYTIKCGIDMYRSLKTANVLHRFLKSNKLKISASYDPQFDEVQNARAERARHGLDAHLHINLILLTIICVII
jgi:hypothetical protein